MGVQSESLTGPLLYAGPSSGKRGGEESHRLWDRLGNIWEGLEQEGLPRGSENPPHCPPALGPDPTISLFYTLCPGPSHPRASRMLPCCPPTPFTPNVFLLLLPGASRPARNMLDHLLSLHCCAPSEQNALGLLSHLCPYRPCSVALQNCGPTLLSQSLHPHFPPTCCPWGCR